MSDESEVGIVLSNAASVRKAFGKNLGALVVLVALYVARKRNLVHIVAWPAALLATVAFQVWLRVTG